MTNKAVQIPELLDIWVVYHDPIDFPKKYVVRKFIVEKPTEIHYVADTLEEVEQHIPEGKVCLSRTEQDDPKIVETWI